MGFDMPNDLPADKEGYEQWEFQAAVDELKMMIDELPEQEATAVSLVLAEVGRLRMALAQTKSRADAVQAARNEAFAEIERLRAYVREQPCECHDEYGKPHPQKCDRCKLFDADLCRQKGWVPGDVLEMVMFPNGKYPHDVVLTAIGWRAILYRLLNDDGSLCSDEIKSSGSLHQYTIQKVGHIDEHGLLVEEPKGGD